MSALCFVDTNVLVYARDASEPEKQPKAHAWLAALWESRCGRTGMQVLNEYFVTVTQKLQPGLDPEEAWKDIDNLLVWEPAPIDAGVLRRAYATHQRFALSWWDALVVAAAQESRCDYFLTEDLQDGQDFDGTKVVSPFFYEVDEILERPR